jgi:DNA topoisomerase-1
MPKEPIIKLTHKEFLKADRDNEQAAHIYNLHYVKDSEPGILRKKNGKTFKYFFEDRVLKEKKQLDRIKKLAIPPAWEKVWICRMENGHIQATGIDSKNRKQYRYHKLWNAMRNETKFHHLYEFGKALPLLRTVIQKDILAKELVQQRVLAILVSLMERTYIRIGNNEYEKMNGSYGLTTLKNKHVSITGDKIAFVFKGKKGIYHNITLKSKKLAKMVKACRDIPGRELFQYYDENGGKRPVDSGMVNNYIKDAMGSDFSAKDFRTWAGSLHALKAFRTLADAETITEKKKNILEVLDKVSHELGNTRTVCKKYYVHPGVIQLYEEDKLTDYFKSPKGIQADTEPTGLSSEEEILMDILKSS